MVTHGVKNLYSVTWGGRGLYGVLRSPCYCFGFVSLRLTILEIDEVENSKCGFIYLLYVYSAHVPKFDDDRIDTLGVVRENA